MNPLKSTTWLEKNIDKVKILDATWHMPNSNRNAFKEYQDNHIQSSIFFDLDKNSNRNISLPHMLPELQEWEKIVSKLGIKNNDHIIIYDNSDVLSASRCWFTFLYFGHDINLVSVLDGGLKKWELENRPLSNEKYTSLASDASSSDDRILAESFLQFADHYYRLQKEIEINNEAKEARIKNEIQPSEDSVPDSEIYKNDKKPSRRKRGFQIRENELKVSENDSESKDLNVSSKEDTNNTNLLV